MNEFENYPELAKQIEKIALVGHISPTDWNKFLHEINKALPSNEFTEHRNSAFDLLQRKHGALREVDDGLIDFASEYEEDKILEAMCEHAIDFAIWYSGMDKVKVKKAYKRFVKEKTK